MIDFKTIEEFLTKNQWVILLITAWSIFWKGMGLWRAARNNHKWWFLAILLLNTLGILEMIYIFGVNKKQRINGLRIL
jgi:hypothetical protein